jgi:hypothetical protein
VRMDNENFEERYPRRRATKATGKSVNIIGALMRALARFPDARKAVIDELDRLDLEIA